MKSMSKTLGSLLAIGVLSLGLAAETTPARRYDSDIESRVVKQLAEKKEFHYLRATTEDAIVTLTGTVDLYQQKLDAARKIRKIDKVAGVRNLIEVSSTVPDSELASQLARKLHYDRIGYGNRFNYVTASVNNGVVTLNGETWDYVGRDSAVSLANNLPGVKDVVNNITVAPTSGFDDDIRLRVTRAIYGDSVLGRYATDPAAPIRIVVENGKVSLYGTVDSAMDKQIAGMRANQVFGVFSVQNNLAIAGRS